MQHPRTRRRVAGVTALLLALSGCLVALSTVPSSAVTAQVSVHRADHKAASMHRTTALRTTAQQKVDRQRQAAKKAAARKAAARKAAARKAAAWKAAAWKAAARKAAAKKAAALARRRAARLARVKPGDPRTWIRFAPDHHPPRGGPLFNNPYGSHASRRVLLTQVIRSIDSSPGYRRPVDRRTHRTKPCPVAARFWPSSIRIAVYSVADRRFAAAIVAAQRRCVSVKILMNSHLTSVTSHSWGRIARALGRRGKSYAHRRSFARRCTNGCLGTSVLHSKFFLFSHPGRRRDTVITGSSNMTKNAIGIQWNDLFTVNGNRRMYAQYLQMFNRMIPDRMARGPFVYPATGIYQSTFYPYRRATRRTDATMRALRGIRCKGANGGTGIRGRTVVYIAMHSWSGDRGDYLARRVRQLYDRGCYVRILYSMLRADTYYRLRSGAGSRMVVRRLLFPGPRGLVAAKYSHMKMFAVSGRFGGDRSARLVWTGSNNWTDRSLHADEVTLRIASPTVYRAYVRHWKFMRHRRSSGFWATYHEPTGGGRAP